MRWNLILLLSLFGAVMGIASLFGFTEGIELFGWIVIALITAFVLAKNTTHKIFVHGLYSGMAMGIVHAVIQAFFFDSYMNNNPVAAEQLQTMIGGISPQIFIVLLSSVVGGIYGLVIGVFSVAASKFHIPK